MTVLDLPVPGTMIFIQGGLALVATFLLGKFLVQRARHKNIDKED